MTFAVVAVAARFATVEVAPVALVHFAVAVAVASFVAAAEEKTT